MMRFLFFSYLQCRDSLEGSGVIGCNRGVGLASRYSFKRDMLVSRAKQLAPSAGNPAVSEILSTKISELSNKIVKVDHEIFDTIKCISHRMDRMRLLRLFAEKPIPTIRAMLDGGGKIPISGNTATASMMLPMEISPLLRAPTSENSSRMPQAADCEIDWLALSSLAAPHLTSSSDAFGKPWTVPAALAMVHRKNWKSADYDAEESQFMSNMTNN
jgi:hypothetical protein